MNREKFTAIFGEFCKQKGANIPDDVIENISNKYIDLVESTFKYIDSGGKDVSDFLNREGKKLMEDVSREIQKE